VEAVALVVVLGSFFTCAKCAEVFCCFRHCLVKDFKDDTRLLVAFLALSTNRNVEVGLDIVLVKLWKAVVILLYLYGILVVVNTLTEESSEASLLLLGLIGFFLFNGLELGSHVRICRHQLDGSFDVDHCLVKFVKSLFSNRAEV